MTSQPSPSGPDEPPEGPPPSIWGRQPTDRLFFGLFPDSATAARIGEAARRQRAALGLKGKPPADDRFHVTLHKIGDYVGLPEAIVAAAGQAAGTLAAAPFEVRFDRVTSLSGRPGNRPFVMKGSAGLEPLHALRDSLVKALRRAGAVRRVQGLYTPHVTLLYDSRKVPYQAVEAIGWTVRDFVLVHSRLGQTSHIILGRWPLAGA